MASLLDEIKAFFDTSKTRTDEETARNAIAVIQGCRDLATLTALSGLLPGGIISMPVVAVAIEAQRSDLEKQGDAGPYAPIAKALFDGFGALSEPIQDGIVDMLRTALVPGSPKITEAVEDSLDLLVDAVLNPIIPADKPGAAEARSQIKAALLPLLRLETTIGIATVMGELIHPAKELGLGNLSHVFHDSFGFQSLSGAAIAPLSRAVVGSPIEKSINKIFQPFLPTEGELTGLARKYEITEEMYRDGMRAHGIKEEYIDALLTGFWADPRLREILLLAQVERPDANAPDAARQWLTRAGLDEYIGPDWWFALKFAKAGYDRIDIPVLIKVVRSQFLIKELGDLRVMRRAQYKSGQISRDTYESFLRSRGLRDEELAPQLDAIESERDKDQRDEMQKLYELQYKNGRITESALRAALVGLKISEDRVNSRVQYLTAQKLGKLREDLDSRVPTRSDLEQAYKRGAISKEALIKRLDDMGYTLADAQLIVDNAENDLIVDVAQEWQRAYEYRTRYGRMTASELKTAIVGLGKSELYAEARTAYIAEVAAGKTGEVEEVPS